MSKPVRICHAERVFLRSISPYAYAPIRALLRRFHDARPHSVIVLQQSTSPGFTQSIRAHHRVTLTEPTVLNCASEKMGFWPNREIHFDEDSRSITNARRRWSKTHHTAKDCADVASKSPKKTVIRRRCRCATPFTSPALHCSIATLHHSNCRPAAPEMWLRKPPMVFVHLDRSLGNAASKAQHGTRWDSCNRRHGGPPAPIFCQTIALPLGRHVLYFVLHIISAWFFPSFLTRALCFQSWKDTTRVAFKDGLFLPQHSTTVLLSNVTFVIHQNNDPFLINTTYGTIISDANKMFFVGIISI